MKYIINNIEFKTKKSLTEYIRSILNSYAVGESLGLSDFNFMYEILQYHPFADEKIGAGISSIYIDRSPTYFTKCFFVKRIDNTSTEFSYRECLTPSTQKAKFIACCRSAVRYQIERFKELKFLLTSHTICSITGQVLYNDENTHVDHIYPFSKLVNDFIKLYNIDINSIQFEKHNDNMTADVFEDKQLEALWCNFHDQHAELQLLSKSANLRKSNFSDLIYELK